MKEARCVTPVLPVRCCVVLPAGTWQGVGVAVKIIPHSEQANAKVRDAWSYRQMEGSGFTHGRRGM